MKRQARGREVLGGTEMPARPGTLRIRGEVDKRLQPGKSKIKDMWEGCFENFQEH